MRKKRSIQKLKKMSNRINIWFVYNKEKKFFNFNTFNSFFLDYSESEIFTTDISEAKLVEIMNRPGIENRQFFHNLKKKIKKHLTKNKKEILSEVE